MKAGTNMRVGLMALGMLFGVSVACQDVAVIVGRLHVPAGGAGLAADGGGAGAAGAAGSVGSAGGSVALTTQTGSPRNARANTLRYDTVIEPGTRDEFCSGKGPALSSGRSGSGAACDYRIERSLFAYALCACDELRLSGDSVVIDSFDSSQAAYKAGQTGMAIGANGSLAQVASDTQLLGSLSVSGGGTLPVTGQNFLVTGDVETNAVLGFGAKQQRVARDLWLADDVKHTNAVRVDSDVHQSPGHTGLDGLSIGGRTDVTRAVRVDPPCACGDAALDVGSLVTAAHDVNDNTVAGFASDALRIATLTTDAQLLPCGRLFASSVDLQTASTYVVAAPGRTTLFVQGDLHVASVATLFVKPTGFGELDLIVGGNVKVEQNAGLELGDTTRPSAMRVYVAGQIQMDGAFALAAHVYAPQASFKIPEPLGTGDHSGSVLARSLELAATRLHYDRAILHAAPACDAPAPQACDDCNQCPDDLACKAGRCAACVSDADCCEPAVCSSGKCQLLVSNWP